MKKGDTDKIVNALVRMRIEESASYKTMLDFLMLKLGYQQSYAYDLIRFAKDKITEIYATEHQDAFDDAIARLDAMYEKEKGNPKLKLEILKEKNKLLGIAKAQKVDVTSNGKELFSGIDISITYTDKNKSGDEA